MYVNEPTIEYEAHTTVDEDEIISECLVILTNITNAMEKHNCNMLDYGYPEEPLMISIEEIRTVRNILFNLQEVHTMY